MTEKQMYNFYLANLGPELGRLLKFKKEDEQQFNSAKKRVEGILEKIYSSEKSKAFREVEKLLDLVVSSDYLSQTDLDTFFYPISLNVVS